MSTTERESQGRWPRSLVSRSSLGPIVAAGLSLVTLGALLWFLHQHDVDEHAKDFESDVESTLQSARLHLKGDEEYLILLASEFSRGALDEASFRAKASRFVADNPELVNIIWADATFVIRWVAPYEPNKQVQGLKLALPEPYRASHLAKSTRNPAYTRVFEVIQGYPALEIYAPVYRGETFLGVIGGVYSCEKILRHTVPPAVLDNNRVSLIGEDGSVISVVSLPSELDGRFTRTMDLSPFGHGITLRLDRYQTDFFDTEVWLLTVLCVALTLGTAYGMWALGREADRRREAQRIVQRERDNLVNLFEAMEDGVAVVSPHYDIEYVNPVLVKDFGPYQGRKCHEYFHGNAQACSWCMMEDVISGKTVHTEWCYPRNERTYDLIDSRVDNPDGTVSKLKIFRDITDRVEADTALRESERRFHDLFARAADALFLHDLEGRIVEVNEAACVSLGYAREELKSLTLKDVQGGFDPAVFKGLVGTNPPSVPTTHRARHTRRDGSSFPVEVRLGSLDYRGEQLVLASARDTSEREAAERATQKKLYAEKAAAEQTRRRLDESESLHRVTAALLQKTTLGEVLDVVCEEAQRLTRATGSGVLLLEGGVFRLTNWAGEPRPRTERIPLEGSFAGLAVERGEPLWVDDLRRYELACYRHPRPHSLIAVPLRVDGGIIGVLDVAGGSGSFEKSDTRVLSHFADQAAVAIQKARLRQRAEEVAVMEERHRLARELHDSVTQALYSLGLYTDAARLAMESDKREVAASHLQELGSLAREALLEMRLLIFELHPPALEREGLIGALETRLAMVESRAGLETDISVKGRERPLSREVEESLYRFAQEALNNVIRHGRAHSLQVRVDFGAAGVTLEVCDDGVGFDVARAPRSGGMGLNNMRERLERIGGYLTVETTPGRGTRLLAEVPL